ncbi:OB-fold nucleic acid binding domain-containing protein [Methanobrevibacter filiformis]|uniref:Replication factor A n=1 Tax=Methanobrevibacter filiformis TaxID=55758 RepID=A0A162FCX2_9EURY|nr:OB-fold nucleic acid binding domain-containing protein [Methanobrevibacter filiformis]KZX11175.1 replication factor A [Methanobrevibacter filiformis]
MDEKIAEEYAKIKDHLSEEEFLEKLENMKKDYENVSFMNDLDIARMIVGTFIDEANEHKSESEEHAMDKIAKLESGAGNLNIIGRVMSISSPKKFKSRGGKEGTLCNLTIADDTGEIRIVLWSENIKLLKTFNEGDVIKITGVDVKDGFRGNKEAHMQARSEVEVLDPENYKTFPEYVEPITQIGDIIPDEKVNIIGRITRIPPVRTFDKNGKEGQVTSLELQDPSGKVSYTLWNNDVQLIEDFELKEGDTVKILSAQARERNDEISLSHWDSRIVKGDFDVPEFKEEVTKIIEAHEAKDVTLLGIITKIHDTISFERADGTLGYVKSIEMRDDTGNIRVTLWGDDTKREFNKGDIIKLVGGNVEFDEYAATGYRVNTNWNTNIIVDPDEDSSLIDVLKEYQNQLGPIKIEFVQDIEEDGEEIDVRGRVISISDPREFQRDDGSSGLVRSIDFSDGTGLIRVSFWDDKAQDNFEQGSALLLENARTRLGLYAVELNIGKTARVIKLSDDEVEDLPSYAELEEMIYVTKKIEDLQEDERNIRLLARIIDLQEPTEFQRRDGTPGLVRSIELGDETGSIRGSMWDDKAEIMLESGDPIKIENPRVTFRNDQLELSISNNTKLSKVNKDDSKGLPSFEELQDMLYVSKSISDLEDDDKNVKIEGRLDGAFGNKILSARCPSCNSRLEQVDNEYVCDYCGGDVDKPKYLLMVPARVEDDTGDIQITFFSKLAEELLGMKTEEIAAIIEDSADEGALEGKVEDLNGREITVIADVNFDEYSEEIRLNPKKILSTAL